jgi:hypothetical protein
MTSPINPGLYDDIKNALDVALRNDGARVTFGTVNEATTWRHRANRYRALLFKHAVKFALPGQTAFTAYDGLVFQLEGTVVIISPRKIMATMTDLSGNPIAKTDEAEQQRTMIEAARAIIVSRKHEPR